MATITVEQVRALSFEELCNQLKPFIYKYSSWKINGYDREDLEQEIRMVIWKCQKAFNPEEKTGHGGTASSFLNFLIRSVENTFGKLNVASNKINRDITSISCQTCNYTTIELIEKRTMCPNCGNRRWNVNRFFNHRSIEQMNENPLNQGKFSIVDASLSDIEATESSWLQRVEQLPADLKERVEAYLYSDGVLGKRDINKLRKLIV